MPADQSRAFSGRDNLETMKAARNYNAYLADLVVGWRGGATEALDFGAGSGTLTALVRARGLRLTCVEQDPVLARTLAEHGFPVLADIGAAPAASALPASSRIPCSRGNRCRRARKSRPCAGQRSGGMAASFAGAPRSRQVVG